MTVNGKKGLCLHFSWQSTPRYPTTQCIGVQCEEHPCSCKQHTHTQRQYKTYNVFFPPGDVVLRGTLSDRSAPFSLTGMLPIISRPICICSFTSITDPLPNLKQRGVFDTAVSESIPPGKSSWRPLNWKHFLFDVTLRSIAGTPVATTTFFL